MPEQDHAAEAPQAAPPPRRGYIPSKNRVCAYTHITEKAHGKPLQACGRCKETLYIDRESQLAHWPQHKRMCYAIENDPSANLLNKQSGNLRELLQSFKIILQNPPISIRGRLFLFLFMELRRMCAINAEPEMLQFMALRDVIVESICSPLTDLVDNREFIHSIWAIPGLANYFLSPDVLTSLAMIDHKKRNEPPPRVAFLSQNRFDPDSIVPKQLQLPTVYYDAILTFFSISREPDQACPNFSHSVGAAIVRTQMEGWKCPYVRACVPVYDDEVPQDQAETPTVRSFLFQATFTTELSRRFLLGEGSPADPQEIALGLTVKDSLMLLLEDESLLFTDEQERLFSILQSLAFGYGAPFRGRRQPATKYAWDAFSLEDRLELLEYLNSREMTKVKHKLNTIRNEDGLALNQYLRLIFGDTSTILKLRALAVGRGRKAHSPQTLVMLHNLYNQLMEARDELSLSPREEVYAYLAVLGQYHEEEHPTEEALPQFPDELQLLVAEFLVKETFPFVQAENLEEAPDEFREEPI